MVVLLIITSRLIGLYNVVCETRIAGVSLWKALHATLQLFKRIPFTAYQPSQMPKVLTGPEDVYPAAGNGRSWPFSYLMMKKLPGEPQSQHAMLWMPATYTADQQ